MLGLLASYLPITLLGALVGLDVVGFPQAMLSRPIVGATLSGMLLGSPGGGLLVGVVLELLAMEVLPVGASWYPEWGTASVVGGAIFVARGPVPAALPLACLAALATAMAGGYTMPIVRRANAVRVNRCGGAVRDGSAREIVHVQLAGLVSDLARGAAITFAALLLFDPLSRAAAAHWTGTLAQSRAVVVAIAASVGVSAIWRVFHRVSLGPWLFAAGLATGLALLWFRA